MVQKHLLIEQSMLNFAINKLIREKMFKKINAYASKETTTEICKELVQTYELYGNVFTVINIPIITKISQLKLELPSKYIIFNSKQLNRIDATYNWYWKSLSNAVKTRIKDCKTLYQWLRDFIMALNDENKIHCPLIPQMNQEWQKNTENFASLLNLMKFSLYVTYFLVIMIL